MTLVLNATVPVVSPLHPIKRRIMEAIYEWQSHFPHEVRPKGIYLGHTEWQQITDYTRWIFDVWVGPNYGAGVKAERTLEVGGIPIFHVDSKHHLAVG